MEYVCTAARRRRTEPESPRLASSTLPSGKAIPTDAVLPPAFMDGSATIAS